MDKDLALQQVKTPAIAIAVLAVISGLLSLSMAVLPIIAFLFKTNPNPQMNVFTILGIILHATGACTMLAALCGAIHMLKLKNWKRAYSGGILVCIPIFCLLFPIGMPLGIWGMRTIHKDGVKELFETSDAATSAEATTTA